MKHRGCRRTHVHGIHKEGVVVVHLLTRRVRAERHLPKQGVVNSTHKVTALLCLLTTMGLPTTMRRGTRKGTGRPKRPQNRVMEARSCTTSIEKKEKVKSRAVQWQTGGLDRRLTHRQAEALQPATGEALEQAGVAKGVAGH